MVFIDTYLLTDDTSLLYIIINPILSFFYFLNEYDDSITPFHDNMQTVYSSNQDCFFLPHSLETYYTSKQIGKYGNNGKNTCFAFLQNCQTSHLETIPTNKTTYALISTHHNVYLQIHVKEWFL